MKLPQPLLGFRRLRYNFENSLSRPSAFIGYVLVTIIFLGIVMAVLKSIIEKIFILNQPIDSGTFFFAFWDAFTQILGFGSTDPWGSQIIKALYLIIGIVISGAVIGFISNMITRTVARLRLGQGLVIESNHTLILGWSNRIFPILKELSIANPNGRKSKIVIFSARSRDSMESDIQSLKEHIRHLKIITRTGDQTNPEELKRVNIYGAKSIIILDQDDSGDADVISTILAIKAVNLNSQIRIIAELDNPETAKIIYNATKGQVIPIHSQDVISRVTAQASRQQGLATVTLDLLDFRNDEIYFTEITELIDKTYSDAVLAFNSASVFGVLDAKGQSHINPNRSYRFQKGDKVIAIAKDHDNVVFTGFTPEISPFLDATLQLKVREPEHLLVIGWSKMGHSVIKEISMFLPIGSTIHIVAQSRLVSKDQLSTLDFGSNFTVTFALISQDFDELSVAATAKNYNEIIILSYRNSLSQKEADAQTMLTILQMNQLFATNERGVNHTRLVAEILDSRKAELARVAGIDDLVMSDNLAALLIAQVSENPELAAIFDDLFDAEGASINIRPIDTYAPLGKEIEFAQLVQVGLSYGDSVIGYRVHANQNSGDAEGVRLNPLKSHIFIPSAGDGIIVIGNVE